ncbi:hypothetical protein INR49_001201 [Caranx melampygus]|nr:hypothetical protein INR49_001201 [Caranx melampygus]
MEVPQPAVKHMEVFVGMPAFLPCDIRAYNKTVSKIVVSRDDLNPSKYVHIQEQGADRYGPQNKVFNGRTSWSDTLGGLCLNETQFSDSGTYTCTLSELGENAHEGLSVVTQTQIQLDVKETCGHEFPSSPAPVFPLSCVVGIILIILVIAAVVAFHLWKKTRADRTITVREGESSVNLPFQIKTDLNPGDRIIPLLFFLLQLFCFFLLLSLFYQDKLRAILLQKAEDHTPE